VDRVVVASITVPGTIAISAHRNVAAVDPSRARAKVLCAFS
jgi:hypothetical protein